MNIWLSPKHLAVAAPLTDLDFQRGRPLYGFGEASRNIRERERRRLSDN